MSYCGSSNWSGWGGRYGNYYGHSHNNHHSHHYGRKDKVDARNDRVTVDEDGAATINVLDNDTSKRGYDLKVEKIAGAHVGQATTVESADGRDVSVTLNRDGTLTVTPGPDFNELNDGESDTVTIWYQASNGRGKTDWAKITVKIEGTTDAPAVSINDDGFNVLENGALSGNILANDVTDGAVSVTGIEGGVVGEAFQVTSSEGRTGTVTVEADGSISFTADGDFETLAVGDSDTITFTYTAGIVGGEGANLIINGDFENNPLNNSGWTAVEGIQGWSSPVGHVEVQESNFQTGNTQGNAVVELDAHYNSTIQQTVSIAEAGTYSLSVDYAARGNNFSTNGFDVIVNGEVVASVRPTASGFQNETVQLELSAGDAVVQFRAAGTSDSIGTVIDNVELRSVSTSEDAGEATVTIVIDGVNDGPVALDDAGSVTEAEDGSFAAVTGNVLTNDSDVDDGDVLAVLSVEGAAGNVGQVISVVSETNGFAATALVNADGSVTVQPGAEFAALADGESDTIVITYEVSDGNGGVAEAELVVTVDGADNLPDGSVVLADDEVVVVENDSTIINILDNDVGGEGFRVDTVEGVSASGPGFVVLTDGGRLLEVSVNPSGRLVVTAGTAFDNLASGATDTVRLNYTASNDAGSSSEAFIDVTIVGINDEIRVSVDEDEIFINQGQVGTGNLFIVDFNGQPGLIDIDGDAAVFEILTQGEFSTATVDANTGEVTFQGDFGFRGRDSFTFQVSDGLSTDTGTVSFEVVNAHSSPVIVAESSDLSVAMELSGGLLTATGTITVFDADDFDFGPFGQQFPDAHMEVFDSSGFRIEVTGGLPGLNVDDLGIAFEDAGPLLFIDDFVGTARSTDFNFELNAGDLSSFLSDEGFDALSFAGASVNLIYTIGVSDNTAGSFDTFGELTVTLGTDTLLDLFV